MCVCVERCASELLLLSAVGYMCMRKEIYFRTENGSLGCIIAGKFVDFPCAREDCVTVFVCV